MNLPKSSLKNCRVDACQKRLLVTALQDVIRDIHDYQRINNLAPNPGKTECWDSVARASRLLTDIAE
jgi:hypothetical protein